MNFGHTLAFCSKMRRSPGIGGAGTALKAPAEIPLGIGMTFRPRLFVGAMMDAMAQLLRGH